VSEIINVESINLPDDYDFREANDAWEYTCRVCDGDVYDQTHPSNIDDFLPLTL